MKTSITIFQFNKKYFIYALLLLVVEILIGLYEKDQVIRPYGGDFLVVILLYCIVRCLTLLSVNTGCILVLLFSYGVEILQYFHFADTLGLQPGSVPYILLGNYFSWADIICYTLGIGTVAFLERIIQSGGRQKNRYQNEFK